MFWTAYRPFSLTLVTICLGLSCKDPDVVQSRRSDRYYPSEHLFFQRSYPDRTIDLSSLNQTLISTAVKERHSFTKRSAGSWINEGPGNAGARINVVAAHPGDPNQIYAGFSAGGLYKTTDGGENWQAIFDDFPFLAIGAIAPDPTDPETVYLGTGDPNISGNPFIGNGVYKSMDGGQRWIHLGLSEVGIVSKLIVDPSNSQVVYAATMGVPYFRGTDRGVYKSLDGGEHWTQILFLGEGTGVIDLAMAPDNPEVLLASGWDRIRNYEESTTFGNGARIYKTVDGGGHWQMLDNGLPAGVHSRIGLAMTPANANRVYAVYVDTTHEVGGVYTSSDQGESWDTVTIKPESGLPSTALLGFGWYFGKIRANPFNDESVYLLGVRLYRYDLPTGRWIRSDGSSTDPVHPDMHDMYFIDESTYLLATDGGLYRSRQNGLDWVDIENIPTTQFYHVAYNPHQPDLVYGGTQDNGSLRGNASQINDWFQYGGGDGFRTLFHPDDPLIWYVEQQYGNLRVTIDGGENFRSATRGIDGLDDRNWDVPVIMSTHDPNIIYYGTTRVWRNLSGAETEFEAISEHLIDENVLLDLTSNITALAESHFDADVLFAGTGDGNLWRTINGGNSWEKSDQGLPDRYITSIHTSPTEEAVVFVSHSGYKAGENIPHIHRSDDKGTDWKDISGDLPSVPVNDLVILPNNDDQVIFAGTDAGVYFTVNAGENWDRLGDNMPIIAVFDLEYNPQSNRLVAGTFGKSVYSFDLEQEGLRGDGSTQVINAQRFTLAVYPNPVSDQVYFEIETGFVDFHYQILTIEGQTISQGRQSSQSIDVTGLGSGCYLLSIATDDARFIGRFIKT